MRFPLGSIEVVAGLLLGLAGCRPEPRLSSAAAVVQVRREKSERAEVGRAKAGTPPVPAVVTSVESLPSPSNERELRLPGGALLVLQEDHIVKTVALQAWVAAGAADEPADRLGVAHLTERLLLAEQARDVAARVHQLGGEAASWTTPDHTVFQVLLPSSRWRLGVELIGAVLGSHRTELAITEAALTRQRQAILAELRQDAAAPQRAAMQALLGLAFTAHPYRRPLLGRTESVGRLTRAQVGEFFAASYTPAHLTLVVTGDFDANLVTEVLQDELAATIVHTQRASAPLLPRAVEPPQSAPRVTVVDHDAGSDAGHDGEPARARVLLGFHGPSARSADVAALDVAAVLLGYGDTARLQRELSRSQRLDAAENPSAVSYTARDPGLFLTGVTVSPGQIEEASRLLTSEALRLGQREVSSAELQRAQRVLLADAAYLRETPTGRARRLGFFYSQGLVPAVYERQVQALTPPLLRQALAHYLTPENLTLVALRPRSPGSASVDAAAGLARKLQQQLTQLAATPRPGRPLPMAKRQPDAGGGVIEYTLASGTRLLILPEHSAEVVGVAALWPGGRRAEDDKTAGAHQLLARLWPRPARARTGEALARELEQIAGTLQPVVEPDVFGLRAEFLSSHLDQGLALVADSLSQPSYSEADVDRERRALIGELRGDQKPEVRGEARGEARAVPASPAGRVEALMASSESMAPPPLPRDDAATAALRSFKSALLPTHPYALEPSVQSLVGLSRRRLSELFRRAYALNKLTIAVVGDVDPAMVVERLDARLSASPAVAAPVAASAAPVFAELAPVPPKVQYLPGQHAHMVLGFRAPRLLDADRYAVEILFELLAGPTGRLSRELTDRQGLAYTVQGVLQLGLDPGYLAFHLATSPQALDVAQTGLRAELHKLIDHPVPAAELLLAQDRLVSQKAGQRQRRDGRALELARALALSLSPAALSAEAYEAGVRAVSVEAVQRAAHSYLDDQRAIVAAVLPDSQQQRSPIRPALAALMEARESPPSDEAKPPAGIKVASRGTKLSVPAKAAHGKTAAHPSQLKHAPNKSKPPHPSKAHKR